MIPVPKLRNPRQDWAQHGPCSPGQSWVLREQEPKERGSTQWTPCLEWQESPFCRRGITDACCHHLAPCSSPVPCREQVLTLRGLPFAHLKSWGLDDVKDVSAHWMFLNFIIQVYFYCCYCSCPPNLDPASRGSQTVNGPWTLGKQRGAWIYSKKLGQHAMSMSTLTCFWSVIHTYKRVHILSAGFDGFSQTKPSCVSSTWVKNQEWQSPRNSPLTPAL